MSSSKSKRARSDRARFWASNCSRDTRWQKPGAGTCSAGSSGPPWKRRSPVPHHHTAWWTHRVSLTRAPNSVPNIIGRTFVGSTSTGEMHSFGVKESAFLLRKETLFRREVSGGKSKEGEQDEAVWRKTALQIRGTKERNMHTPLLAFVPLKVLAVSSPCRMFTSLLTSV